MNLNHRTIIAIASLFGAAAVLIGAFGAHMFKHVLESNGRAETYELGVRYLFFHTFALFLTGLVRRVYSSMKFAWAALCFISGMVLFSGSLIILALMNVPAWGAVTPFGGLLLIAGWLLLFLGALKKKQ